jgi:hypothetical protein
VNKKCDIVSARVVGVKKTEIICETENDEIILVEPPKTAKMDKYFTKIMFDLLHSGLWIPINRKLKRLLKYDWLDDTTRNATFG